MNTTLLLMFVLPIICGALLFYKFKTHISRAFGRAGWLALPAVIVPGALLIGVVFAASYGSAVIDTEIWNGKVTGKDRKHDSYQRSYDCNCRTVRSCSGSGKDRSCSSREICDTCYEDRYTVTWKCNSTIGDFTIQKLDEGSRSVYNHPDPDRFTSILVGDPVAKTNTYTNYVQAVPESLFSPANEAVKRKFANMLPAYPVNIYDIYRIDRFVQVGFNFTDAAQWNKDISNMLRDLGPSKQVNAIVVLVKTADPNYVYALRDAWEGANKNDVVLVIGSLDGRKVEFADVISWTKRELFKIELRDSIMQLPVIDRQSVLKLLETQISKNFERRRMREFEYLAGEIDPPMWLLLTTALVIVVGYAAAGFIIHRNGLKPKFRRYHGA